MAHVATITIDHTKVAGDLTDYVGLIVPDSDAGWAALYALCLEGGGDIRVFKSDDTTELAREIVSFSVSAETGEIHFKYSGTLSSSVDTDIHIYADGVSSDYAVTDTYGRDAVWSSYTGVFHLENEENSSGGTDLTNTGSITYSANKIGKGANGGNSTSKYLKVAETLGFTASGNSTWNLWYTPAATTGGYILDNITISGQNKRLIIYEDNAQKKLHLFANGNEVLTSAYTTGVRYKVDIVKTGTGWELFFNGVSQGTTTTGGLTYSGGAGFAILNSLYTGGAVTSSSVDEVRTSTENRSSNWITTEYNNQNSPSTFYAVDTAGAAPTPTYSTMLMMGI